MWVLVPFTGYLVGEGNVGLPDGRWWRFLYCSLLNVISLVVCLIGAGMFAKTSVVVLGCVCISLLSVIISFCIRSPMKVNAGCLILGTHAELGASKVVGCTNMNAVIWQECWSLSNMFKHLFCCCQTSSRTRCQGSTEWKI